MAKRWTMGVALAAVLAIALGTTDALAQGKSTTSPAQAPQAVGTLSIEGVADIPTPIYSFGLEMTQSATFGGGGGGAGKTDVSDITVTRLFDALSPALFRAGALGQHLASARVDVYDPGTTTVLASYRLVDVLISGIANHEHIEQVSLRFTRIEITAGGTTTCYDIGANASC
jgi:type VI protein secretion system component Hcp